MLLRPEDGERLPSEARRAVERHFGLEVAARRLAGGLPRRACFVTLTRDGQLRGCVGALRPRGPLLAAVRRHAVSAARHDPRFRPLAVEELAAVRFEVTVLSALSPVDAQTRPALEAALQPGADGLLLECDSGSATFLPQVWRQLGEPTDFVTALLEKAGLAGGLEAEAWPESMRAWRYAAESWSEAATGAG